MDGKGQSKADAPERVLLLRQQHHGAHSSGPGKERPGEEGQHVQLAPAQRGSPATTLRATQKYFLYGSSRRDAAQGGRRPGRRRLDADRASEHRRVLWIPVEAAQARAAGGFDHCRQGRRHRQVSLFALGRSADRRGGVRATVEAKTRFTASSTSMRKRGIRDSGLERIAAMSLPWSAIVTIWQNSIKSVCGICSATVTSRLGTLFAFALTRQLGQRF